MKSIFYLLFLSFLCSTFPLFGQTFINNSSTLKNSSGGFLVIQGNLNNQSGASITNNGNIRISGDMTNNGSSMSMGTTEMDGTAQQSVLGAVTIDFTNLTMNNSSTGALLSNNINVSNNLTMTDGDINLNGSTIELSTTGTLVNETADKRIYGATGVIQATRNLNAPATDNVAGLGLEITSASNLGSTQIVRGHTPQTGLGNLSIERYYDVSPTNNISLNASINFNYFEVELPGHTEANLGAYKSTDGGVVWTVEGGTPVPASDLLTLGGIPGFSRWTLSDIVNNPLPVELLEFTAQLNERNQVDLKWSTAAEINSDYFEVQRSKDAIEFSTIGKLDAKGFSETESHYDLKDPNPFTGVSYYRLKQFDQDGTFTFSEIRVINLILDSGSISLFPNPVQNNGSVILQGLPTDRIIRFQLYNALGQLLTNLDIERQHTIEIELKNFPAGTYSYLIFDQKERLLSGKLIITE